MAAFAMRATIYASLQGKLAAAGTRRISPRLVERGRWRPVSQEGQMGFGRGALLWLLGIPLPIIILLALFWHH
jgi:hypothetical protein